MFEFVDSSEYRSLIDSGRHEPGFELLSNPFRDRYGSDVASLTNQIDDRPAPLPLFEIPQPKCDSLMPTQTAGQKQ